MKTCQHCQQQGCPRNHPVDKNPATLTVCALNRIVTRIEALTTELYKARMGDTKP